MDIEVNKSSKSNSSSAKKAISLETLLQDQEVAEFYQFVHENKLREKAIAILDERIENLKKLQSEKLSN